MLNKGKSVACSVTYADGFLHEFFWVVMLHVKYTLCGIILGLFLIFRQVRGCDSDSMSASVSLFVDLC